MIFDTDNRETLELARQNPYRPRQDDPAGLGELATAGFDQLVSEEQSVSARRWARPYEEQRRERIRALIGQDPDQLLTSVYLDAAAGQKLSSFLDAGEIVVGGAPGPVQAEPSRAVAGGFLGLSTEGARALRTVDSGLMGGLPLEVEFTTDRARKWAQKNPEAFRSMLYVRALKEQDPSILTDEEILEQIAQRTAIMRESNQEVIGRAQGFLGHASVFAGAALGAVTDPPILLTMPLGGAAIRGPSVGWNAARAFGREALIATGVEVPIQAQVWGFKQQIESPWGAGPAAFNVLAAAIGAGTIRATASAGIDVSKVLWNRTPLRLIEAERIITEHLNAPLNVQGAEQMLANYRGAVVRGLVDPTPESDRAAQQLETFVEVGQENRLGPDRVETHFDRTEAAMDDIVATRQTDAMIGPEEVPVLGGRPASNETLVIIDPDILEVDAARFQFKHGADDLGVTDRLRGVERFDKLRAGVVVVYEDLAGRFFIVDGHQRLALARRARAAGQDPAETRLPAHVLREADGVTPGQARQNAALKNIAEGTGTAIDAAKVLREVGAAGEDIVAFNLPPNSALVRNARGLAKLDDESFQLVINDIVPEGYAAIVGERILDPRQQSAVIRLLARTDPANTNQARMIVEQARAAGFETRTTEDLFGETTVAESYYIERAKVLDAAMRNIRRDRQAFKTAVSRGTTLEEAGNVLNQEANAARLASDDELLTALAVTANQRGAVSDALNAAARRVRDGERPAAVVDDFLGTLRAEGLRDGPPGAPAGGARSAEEITGILEDTLPPEAIRMNLPDGPAERQLAEIQRLTEENRPIVRELMQEIDQRFGTESGDNVKAPANVLSKAQRPSILQKKPWFSIAHVRDTYRFKSVLPEFNTLDNVPAIVEMLRARGIQLVKVDTAKLFEPEEWGWRIVSLDLRMKNGQLVEYYLPIRDLEAEKKARGHLLFEQWRNKTEAEIRAAKEEYKAAIAASRKGYNEAFSTALARSGLSVDDAAASWSRVESSLSDASRKSPSSSGMITSSSVRQSSTQVPSSSRLTDPSPARNNQTREVPSSTNANVSRSGLDIDLPPDPILAQQRGADNTATGRAAEAGLAEAGPFRTGEPVTFNFVRNPQRAPRPGADDTFGQRIEPKGRYMNERTTDPGQVPEGLEQGAVTFERPLVINYGESTGAWKQRLSEAYGGATGEELSRALARDGYDGIVTVEFRRGQASTSEIVDLTSFREARQAPESDLFGPAPVREQALADANRAVDERLGAGREAVPAESRGDLFDPNRERQIDLTDARIQRVAQERGLDMPTLERAELDELDRFLREEGQLLELPDRIELDADGNPIVIGRRANEVFSELDGQARALDAIELCAVGGAA